MFPIENAAGCHLIIINNVFFKTSFTLRMLLTSLVLCTSSHFKILNEIQSVVLKGKFGKRGKRALAVEEKTKEDHEEKDVSAEEMEREKKSGKKTSLEKNVPAIHSVMRHYSISC